MNEGLTAPRRLLLAVMTLAAAVGLFRAQLADALVVRGDELLFRGSAAAAWEHYTRALALDPQSPVAVDRYVFVSMERHTPAALAQARAAANEYLRQNPNDATILADRAMCNLLMRRYGDARRDYERAGETSGDPRYFVFAGWAARRTGDAQGARRLWQFALRLDKHFGPALIALSEDRS